MCQRWGQAKSWPVEQCSDVHAGARRPGRLTQGRTDRPHVGRSNVSCFRHYTLDATLPLRLRPESMEKLRCLRACVIRSLYHMYEPFAARISKNPAIPESTPSTLKNSKVSENPCGAWQTGTCVVSLFSWLVSGFSDGEGCVTQAAPGVIGTFRAQRVTSPRRSRCAGLAYVSFNRSFLTLVVDSLFSLF